MANNDKYIPISRQLSKRILAINVITTCIVAILVLVLSTLWMQKTFNAYFTNGAYGANESVGKRLGKVSADSLYRHVKQMDLALNQFAPFSPNDTKSMDEDDVVAYHIIFDGTGNYIHHPDRQHIGTGNFFDDIRQTPEEQRQQLLQELAAHKKGKQEITLNGNSSYIFFISLEGTSNTTAVIVPRRAMVLPVIITRLVLLAIIILGFVIIYRKSYRTIRHATAPLRLLTRTTDEMAKGNFMTPLPEIWRNNEVRHLRDSFANMQQSLTQYIDQLQEATARETVIKRDLETAMIIQTSMIPKVFPKRDDIDIYGSMTPAQLVGGDFYDFLIKDHKLYFCIGDVSGKGIPAALFMTVSVNLFRAFALEGNTPVSIVSRMNHNLCQKNPEYMFITLLVGVLDMTSGLLQYCNAGHTIPFLITETVEELPLNHHPAVGAFDNIKYQMQEVILRPQTTLLFYTDGLNEATNADNKLFGKDRILDELNRTILDGQTTPRCVIDHMAQAVHTFVGDAAQSDDLTMFCLKYQ